MWNKAESAVDWQVCELGAWAGSTATSTGSMWLSWAVNSKTMTDVETVRVTAPDIAAAPTTAKPPAACALPQQVQQGPSEHSRRSKGSGASSERLVVTHHPHLAIAGKIMPSVSPTKRPRAAPCGTSGLVSPTVRDGSAGWCAAQARGECAAQVFVAGSRG